MNTTTALPEWTLIQISDTHLMDQVDSQFVKMNPEQSFHAVMQHILSQHAHIDALVHTGDLAQVPAQVTYERYLKFMQSTQLAHYQIPGNHDNSDIFPFKDGLDQANIFHLGNWSVILLNSAIKGKIDGWIEQEQLQQLDQLLEQHQNQHIIVACHHHPFIMHSRWIDQHRLKNTEHLTDVLARHAHVKMVLCGHVHQDSCHEWQGIQFLSTPATSVQFKPRSHQFALDDQAPGYRVVKLFSDGMFQTEVKRVSMAQQKFNAEISGY